MRRSLKRAVSTPGRTRTALPILVAIAVLTAAGVAGAAMAQGKGRALRVDRANVVSPGASAATIIDQIGSDRVSSISQNGSSVVVTGLASGPGADTMRTLWYESVAGAAFAQQTQATSLTRNVVNASGEVIDTETDPITSSVPAAAPTASAQVLTSGLSGRVAGVGAAIVSVHYISLLGGTAEIVVQPNDPMSFARAAGENVGTLLGSIGDNDGAYLVTVVGADESPLIVLGSVPDVGGSAGQGVGWEAPGVQSDAIWGAYHPAGD